jgi:hypothetical protein
MVTSPIGMTTDVRVHCLSDVAMRDDLGAPTCQPSARDFGLPASWRHAPARSDVGLFSYSPFHGKRGRRDGERCGFARGSVIVFVGEEPVDRGVVRAHVAGGVGAHRVEGFGRVAIDPWYLHRANIDCMESRSIPSPHEPPTDALAGWMQRVASENGRSTRSIEIAHEMAKKWEAELRHAMPTLTQWNRLAQIAFAMDRAGSAAGNFAALVRSDASWKQHATVLLSHLDDDPDGHALRAFGMACQQVARQAKRTRSQSEEQ